MSSNLGLTTSDLDSVKVILGMYPEVKEAIVYGSRAKGNFRQGSDVDIALKGPHLTRSMIVALSYKLNEETLMPYHFDVVGFTSIRNGDIVEHINRVGIRIY